MKFPGLKKRWPVSWYIKKRWHLPGNIGLQLPDKAAIVFVHGLAGSRYTWCVFSNLLDKSWDDEDSFKLEYQHTNIEIYRILGIIPFFRTIVNFFTGGPNIEVLAKDLKTTIDVTCSQYKYIFIIAHSMGGLVARKYIVDALKCEKDVKVKVLITYATPHFGSRWATLFNDLSLMRCLFTLIKEQINQMSFERNGFLQNLNSSWAQLNIESKLKFIKVVAGRDWLVNPKSAGFSNHNENAGNEFAIANKTHFSIIQPKNKSDRAFQITYLELKRFRDIIFDIAMSNEVVNEDIHVEESDDEIN
jgi:pimeloyl-ACP methyl ester carboxylesterase